MDSTQQKFLEKARIHWSDDRLKKLTSGHKYKILPTNAASLLRTIGILNADGTMSADATRKYIQINHLLNQLSTHLDDLNSRHTAVRILDAGCGSSFLTFILTWAYRELWKHPVFLVGTDTNKSLIDKSKQNAIHMGVTDLVTFVQSAISDLNWNDIVPKTSEEADAKTTRPHAVLALHACDTATDDAIAFGIQHKADFIAVAPCCQAELAKSWKAQSDGTVTHPLRPLFHNPHLRRETAAQLTDMLRVLILRGHGYEVTATEFTMSHATPKNTLLLATRRGNFHRESQKEYQDLVEWIGGMTISLATKAPFLTIS